MKHFATILFLFLLATTCNAQISFSADEFLAAFGQSATSGTTFSSTDLSGVDALIAKSGAGQSWDFGNRIYTQNASSTATTTILTNPGDAPLGNDPDFSGSTHVIKTVQADPTRPISYLFIKLDQTGYWWLGFSQDSMGVKRKIASYVPPQQQLKFPLTYQTSWQSTSNVNIGLPPGSSYTIAVDAIADAYGTLITPTSAHKQGNPSPMASGDALRVKTKNTTTSSFTIPGVGTFGTTTVDYSFQYYTKNGHSANIGADTNVAPTSISYSVLGGSGVADNYSPENSLELNLSANPASNTVTTLSVTMKKDGNLQVGLIDALGNQVRILHNGFVQVGESIIPIDPSKLSPGIYFIRVSTPDINATRKLIITK
jgi:hypothetical protein